MKTEQLNDWLKIDLPSFSYNVFIHDGMIDVGCLSFSKKLWESYTEGDIKALAYLKDFSKNSAIELWRKYRDRVLALCA